jgi:uncharacterized Rmd1/YagE family protein
VAAEGAAGSGGGGPREHRFDAVAFVENFSLKDLLPTFPAAKASPLNLRMPLDSEGECFVFPFGAVVFRDTRPDRREEVLARLLAARPGLTTQTVKEDFTVREGTGDPTGLFDGVLFVDALTPERVEVIALTVGQSAAMEYYERQVDRLFGRATKLGLRLEATGRMPWNTRSLHRFVGEALSTRAEVIDVLHLLDKPEATWEDPVMGRIYGDLRDEFDLFERYEALEARLGTVLEAVEVVLDVARDRRFLILEAAIVLLIAFEIALTLSGR